MEKNEQSCIKVSRIEKGELILITGYMWETTSQTRSAFENERTYDIGYKEGGICLDLYNYNDDIEDTITITESRFMSLISS